MRECAGGPTGALGARPRLPRPRCPPPPWVQGPPRWGAGPLSLRQASVRSWAGPLTPPPDGRGGAVWRFRPREASRRLGGRTLPPTPLPCDSRTLVQSLAWVPFPPCCRRTALAGWGGGRAIARWGRL